MKLKHAPLPSALEAGLTDRPWPWGLLWIGPALLAAVCIFYGITEVHSSTDCWIGLAAGRQILQSETFPKYDTFSYTFYQATWYNQNWLTHVWLWWLCDTFGRDAVIYGTWGLSTSILLLVGLATWFRTRSLLATLLAIAAAGYGCREFISPRPATVGFFCMAAMWALLCALEGQRQHRRWWPIVLLLPLLVVWGNAHGSFIMAYALLAMYAGHACVVRAARLPAPWRWPVSLTLLVGPLVALIYFALSKHSMVFLDEPHLTLGFLPDAALAGFKPLYLRLLPAVIYVIYWSYIQFARPQSALSPRQIIALVVVIALGLLLTGLFGPYGWENFAHGEKVAESTLFRTVAEWHPLFTRWLGGFPKMDRFFQLFGIALSVFFIALVTGVILRLSRGNATQGALGSSPVTAHVSAYDVLVVLVALGMTSWARRFAPMFYIFAIPTFLTATVWLLEPVPRVARILGRRAVMAVSGVVGVLFLVLHAWPLVNKELIRPLRVIPNHTIFDRVTRFDSVPREALEYIRRNKLTMDLFCEWTVAGAVMFETPGVRVFIDGRSQQIYTEEAYRTYQRVLVKNAPAQYIIQVLNNPPADAVLLRATPQTRNFWDVLWRHPDWVLVLHSRSYGLFVRKTSDVLRRIGQLVRSGQEWRPKHARALASRGMVYMTTQPRDPARALSCWVNAIEQQIDTLGAWAGWVVRVLVQLDRLPDAQAFLQRQRQRVLAASGLSTQRRNELLGVINQLQQQLQRYRKQRRGGRPSAPTKTPPPQTQRNQP